jgi:LacI family transcriptional regulator
MPTIRDVAKLAGVSTATVSAAVTGSAYVSPILKSRVLVAIEQLGYSPDGVARSLKKGVSNLLGLILPDITNPFFTEFVQAAEGYAQEAGYSVLLCDSGEDLDKELAYLRLMRSHRVAGLILCPVGTTEIYESTAVRRGGLPVVLVDRRIPGLEVDTVTIDNYTAALEATRYLLDLGHSRVATIAGIAGRFTSDERLRGFRDALAERRNVVAASYIRHGNYLENEAFRVCCQLLRESPAPTALFVANNHMLIGVMRAVTELGLTCPKDISIAAIDDFPWANAFTPRLTTIRQPVRQMAEEVVRLLLRRIAGEAGEPVNTVLEASLIVRESCAPHPDRLSAKPAAARKRSGIKR